MRQKDPESSLIAIINRAQNQLPKDRRRSIPSVQSVPWVKVEIQKMFETQREQARAAEIAGNAAKSAKDRQVTLQGQLQEMVRNAKESALHEAEIEDLVGEVLGRFIKEQDELRRRVVMLEGRVGSYVNRTPAKEVEPAPTKRLPPILVAGLLPDQQNKVRAHFRNAADMRFLGSSDQSKGVPQAVAAVINTKFIPHNFQSLIQREIAIGGGKTYLVSGGISSVVERIEKLLPELTNGHANA